MSFEGYYQILCCNGHLSCVDAYETPNFDDHQDSDYDHGYYSPLWKCPYCKGPAAWWNLVDETNGAYCECNIDHLERSKGCENCDRGRIDRIVDLEVDNPVISPRTYKIPKQGGCLANTAPTTGDSKQERIERMPTRVPTWELDFTFRLCYVRGDDAYFTTAPIIGDGKQWGDDWDDAPYEHNAEPPYEWREESGLPKYQIQRLKWEGDWEEPSEGMLNSPYSVEDINCGTVPWLRLSKWNKKSETKAIYSGTCISEFIKIIKQSGGRIWVERGNNQ